MSLSPGDRVEHALLDHRGTVEEVGAGYVRVRWEDGQVGLLYDNPGIAPNTKHLLRLAPQK